jgi:hypothetical protein
MDVLLSLPPCVAKQLLLRSIPASCAFKLCALPCRVMRTAALLLYSLTTPAAAHPCCAAAGYLMRSNVSATAGVVVGVVCKIGSIVLNLLIWSNHASPIQLFFLALGLAGGSLFQQAPLREKQQPKLPLAAQDMHVDVEVGSAAAHKAGGLHATRPRTPSR